MAANTLLCIHRDPAQLSLLRENGYELVTATSGCEGLRLFMARSVDAIVLDYHLALLDGGVVAAEIKKVNSQVPIVMLTDQLELPDGTLKSVDALVAKSDGPHFLLATVHFVLSVKPARGRLQGALKRTAHRQSSTPQFAMDHRNAPFSPRTWRNIRNGTIQF